ncbi:MAG: PLP-dependent cysteine synthase family protein [Pseudomonadota bacterium]
MSGVLASHERVDPCDHVCRQWIADSVAKLEADARRSADTHVYALRLPSLNGVSIFLKDESAHPTGSLKHRLARSLMLYGLCNGCIGPETVLVEASSGSTAVSEAYFAQLLGLKFIAVVPDTTTRQKITEIERYGGVCEKVPSASIYQSAERIAHQENGYYLDQFTFAERATDWRGNNNIAESLFHQMGLEDNGVPDWIVVGAGTGGTSATLGRYVRYRDKAFAKTRICVADPEGSVFFSSYEGRNRRLKSESNSRIEGVGRPRVEPSFIDTVVDRMVRVRDDASFATMIWLQGKLNRRVGPSSGLNLYAALYLAVEMQQAGKTGSIATLICDSGERYECTAFNPSWRDQQGIHVNGILSELETNFG